MQLKNCILAVVIFFLVGLMGGMQIASKAVEKPPEKSVVDSKSAEKTLSDVSLVSADNSVRAVATKKTTIQDCKPVPPGQDPGKIITIDENSQIDISDVKIQQMIHAASEKLSDVKTVEKNYDARLNALAVYDSERKQVEGQIDGNYKIHAAMFGMDLNKNWRVGYGLGFSF